MRVYCAAVQLSGQKQFRPVSSAAYMTIKQVAVQAIAGFKLEVTTHVSVTHELNINTQTYCTRSKHHNHAVLLLDYFSPYSVLICNQFCQLSQRRQARQVLQLVALDKEAPEPCQTLQLQGLEGCEPIASRMQIAQVRQQGLRRCQLFIPALTTASRRYCWDCGAQSHAVCIAQPVVFNRQDQQTSEASQWCYAADLIVVQYQLCQSTEGTACTEHRPKVFDAEA